MSLRGHVSSNIGGRSEIKNLINELITEIEREHGLDKFPERYNQIDENLDLESKKSPKKGPMFQNLKAHSCENVTDPVTFFQKMSYRGYILFRIRFHSNFF